MDELKKYIEDNYESMEFDSPGERVWKGIHAAAVPVKSKRNTTVFFRAAAAASVLLIIAAGIKWLSADEKAGSAGNLAIHPLVKQPAGPVVKHLPPVDSLQKGPVIYAAHAKIHPKRKESNPRNSMINSLQRDYVQVVNLQVQSIKSIPVYGESPSYFEAFRNELQQLDLNERALRTALKQNGMKDELMEKLIDVYQQKLNLLKTLREEINKMNDRVEEKSISTAWYINI